MSTDVRVPIGTPISNPGQYGMARRRLGITYVGTVVVVSLFFLFSGSVITLFGRADSSFVVYLRNIALFLSLFALFSLPFDFIGYSIEKKFGKTGLSPSKFLSRLVPAVIGHISIYLLIAASSCVVSSKSGVFGLMVFLTALMVAVIYTQKDLVRLYAPIVFTPPGPGLLKPSPVGTEFRTPVILAETGDNGFTGGIVGLPGAETIVLPKHWLSSLSPHELRAEVVRRNAIIASGGRTRGVAVALIFTILGLVIAASLTSRLYGLPLYCSAGQVTMSLCFTIWSFVGLLFLPYWSRMGVYEADRLAVESGTSSESMHSLFEKINGYLEDEPDRSQVVETIFHPVPTVQNRMQNISSGDKVAGAWHCVRYAIAISPVGLGLLNRAVHCNAGRPALWAMPPAD